MIIKKQVFQFNISMSDAPVVAISDAFNNLFKDSFCFVFFKSSVNMAFEISVKTSTTYILHNEDNVLARVYYLV